VSDIVALRKAQPRIREFALIRTLARRFARRTTQLIRGIGDDAAVLASPTQGWWHVTTDLLAEGIHFDMRTASLESVGYRAAMVNLSDIAAMGAVPRYVLISLAMPSNFGTRQTIQLYTGLMKACRPRHVILIGGDTSASKAGLFVSLTILGTTKSRRALFRHGARVGDDIYVTGTLGDSLAGLQLLARVPSTRPSRRVFSPLRASHKNFLINRHLHPAARLAEGQWLNNTRLATAAIDLSDGLSGDLRHLCEESRVGAEIELNTLPISAACRGYAKSRHMDAALIALRGGEDYELLFSAAPMKRASLARHARARGFHVTRIGTIRPRRFGMQMNTPDGTLKPIPNMSYEHFC